MKVLIVCCRLLIGFVFIFSGFVKGVDPLGTAYRLEDYFIAYGTEWAIPLALGLSITLSTLEFTLGIILIFNSKIKQISWFLLFIMISFTVITFFDALYEPVPDCGCFGDAIKLTNPETFIKNIFLLIFVVFIFITRNKLISPWSKIVQWIIIIAPIIIFTGFSLYNYNHLPMLDFRDWKVGNNMAVDKKEPDKIYLTYKNKETGEEKEFLTPNYPWDDSVWMSEWEFVSQRIETPEGYQGYEIKIEDVNGDDYTEFYIENENYQFIVIAYDLGETDKDSFKEINKLAEEAEKHGFSLIVITSNIPSKVDEFKEEIEAGYEFYYADDIILKTIIRSNPGLLLMKDGIILVKWHYNDLPSFEEIESEYMN